MKYLALLLLLFPALNYCPIHTTEDITDIKKYIKDPERTTLFMDVDKTLIYYWPDHNGKDKVFLVDDRSPSLIKDIQQKIPVVGLTARNSKYQKQTYKQLKRHQIDFTQTTPFADQVLQGWMHSNGIIYTNGGPKGTPVVEFLIEDAHPAEVVMATDDQEDILRDLEYAINNFNIETRLKCGLDPIQFIGIHYTRYKQVEEMRKAQEALQASY